MALLMAIQAPIFKVPVQLGSGEEKAFTSFALAHYGMTCLLPMTLELVMIIETSQAMFARASVVHLSEVRALRSFSFAQMLVAMWFGTCMMFHAMSGEIFMFFEVSIAPETKRTMLIGRHQVGKFHVFTKSLLSTKSHIAPFARFMHGFVRVKVSQVVKMLTAPQAPQFLLIMYEQIIGSREPLKAA